MDDVDTWLGDAGSERDFLYQIVQAPKFLSGGRFRPCGGEGDGRRGEVRTERDAERERDGEHHANESAAHDDADGDADQHEQDEEREHQHPRSTPVSGHQIVEVEVLSHEATVPVLGSLR